MKDREDVIKGLEICVHRVPGKYDCSECPYEIDGDCCAINLTNDALSMLKEQDEQKREWLQAIADNQLANAPTDTMDATQNTYYDGVWHGLQMAWDIITGRSVK